MSNTQLSYFPATIEASQLLKSQRRSSSLSLEGSLSSHVATLQPGIGQSTTAATETFSLAYTPPLSFATAPAPRPVPLSPCRHLDSTLRPLHLLLVSRFGGPPFLAVVT